MKKSLPTRYFTTVKPKEYLVQGLTHCGAYSVKAILSAYGKDNKKHPKDYHTHLLNKIIGGGLTKNYYVNILKSYGLEAEFKDSSSISTAERINLLKSLLVKNAPVMIAIGNGYNSEGTYNSLLAAYQSHWITLWGFDDNDQAFYLYDSCVKSDHYDKDIPIGNKKRSYKEIIRDWKGSLITRLLYSKEYGYIEINL